MKGKLWKLNYEFNLGCMAGSQCPECARLDPEFAKAAVDLKDHDPPIVFAKEYLAWGVCSSVTNHGQSSPKETTSKIRINCYGVGKETCKNHSISRYPEVKVFRNGAKAFDYNGPRDSDGMVPYIRKNVPLISKELMSVDDVQAFIDRAEYSVIGFFERRDSVIFERYEMFASTLNEHFRFGHTFNEDVLENYGYKNTFLVFRSAPVQSKLEPDRIEYHGVYSPMKMRNWLLANVFGLVGHRTKQTASFFSYPLVVVYFDIDYIKNAKAVNYWRNRILKVAQTFNSASVTFAMSDAQDFEQELSELGITSDPTQPTVIGYYSANQSYVINEDFSVEALESFVRRLLSGTLKRHSELQSSDDNTPESEEQILVSATSKTRIEL